MNSQTTVKVNCTLVQALRLCTGRTAHRESRGTAIPFHDHGSRRGWGVVTPRPLFTPGKDPVPIVQEARWTPGPVWTGAENLAPTGIRSPDCPAHSQLLYRLSYPTHRLNLRKKLLKRYIWSIALYGAETWTLWEVCQIPGKFLKMVLNKIQMDWSCERWRNIMKNQGGMEHPTYNKKKEG